jgi:hypothetical protein
MRNKNYARFIGIFILSLFVSIQFGTAQNSVLVLKGNVLTPVPVQSTNTTTTTAPAKKKTPAVSTTSTTSTTTTQKTSATTTTKSAPVVAKTPKPKPAPAVVKAPTPKPKPAPVVAKAPAPKPAVKAAPAPKPAPKVAAVKVKKGPQLPQVDYIKRVQFVHNLVTRRIPQSIIDSISDINHFMLDSIRAELTKHMDKDSISFLKTALSNGVNDSVTLMRIDFLVNSAKGTQSTLNTGAVNAYCIDLASQAPMDSVKVSIFSHDSLIANSFSSNDGFCKIADLSPGEYSLSFSKNNYTPFSDRWVKVTAGNVTYLEMPLTETPRFYLPKFSVQIWAMIIVGVISVFILIYSIIRRLGRVA